MSARSSARWFDPPIGEDVDGKPIPPEDRWFDKRRHPCGCVTVFDTGAWTSLTLYRCASHARTVAHV